MEPKIYRMEHAEDSEKHQYMPTKKIAVVYSYLTPTRSYTRSMRNLKEKLWIIKFTIQEMEKIHEMLQRIKIKAILRYPNTNT